MKSSMTAIQILTIDTTFRYRRSIQNWSNTVQSRLRLRIFHFSEYSATSKSPLINCNIAVIWGNTFYLQADVSLSLKYQEWFYTWPQPVTSLLPSRRFEYLV